MPHPKSRDMLNFENAINLAVREIERLNLSVRYELEDADEAKLRKEKKHG